MKNTFLLLFVVLILGCVENKKGAISDEIQGNVIKVDYAKGFSISKSVSGITTISVSSPWPNATADFTYALVPKKNAANITVNKNDYDAIVFTPVESLVATSTTHIPALEALGVIDKLVGFPDSKYISSKAARKRIAKGEILELGNNESMNGEMVIALRPDVVIGFSINNQNKAYNTLERAGIPVVYNGEWTEETPLGRAEWIKFFAPFFELEDQADSIFNDISSSYKVAKNIAAKAKKQPTILSGALYKDVWYLPGGKSWAAQFLKDANTRYLWQNNPDTGSVSLSLESVLQQARDADFWISPSQFTTYDQLELANRHYSQFKAYREQKVFTFAATQGETGGLLYYELGPHRPDLILKDLIHIFHPELLPEHNPFFFKPLK
ncbi:ABC transporter substrate-binding protein [Muriicola sp. Z0-33]|uniref:ABC transporter substrate-binding protein n=1 Tax=Muriicola sp. Z0-33 TaxID=2816957 RepID=UPI002237D760|nr:ABC transporter substrate-binding protein [Muriicola sp. Z0-33]MCW5517081.1 ABC transporter substrate-binding protein [Muriicola sp. Z0-33]